MARIDDVLNIMKGQIGKPYKFAAPVSLQDPNPPEFDCSALIYWASGRAGAQPLLPRVSMQQHQAFIDNGTLLGDVRSDPGVVARTLGIRGAILIRTALADGRTPCDPAQGDAGRSHIAISMGEGNILEAQQTGKPVGIYSANPAFRIWTAGGLLPGVDYSTAPPGLPGNSHARTARPHLLHDFRTDAKNYRGADRTAWVSRMQQLLIERGLLQISAPTGFFRNLTLNALLAFQQYVATHHVNGFAVDGDCGPQTWGWLLYLTGHGLEE
jgi:hypothetical protein